ncbi:hypothetical protein HF086_000362 [Spodoptera exigua]|uniref:HTH psq-type domain-containing protein n=1 Tax=Spodoptera exigua TaxID=7107 RepID=A0A922SCK3_SPOEX|nr:hypothetical protein HF086_000362 [Spodoptera exigua]
MCCPCQDNHKLANCKRFAGLDIEKRRNFVQTNGLCYNCLGANHSVYPCRQSSRCYICKRKHHSLLHLKNVSKSGGDSNNPDQVVESSGSAVTTSNQSNSTNIVSCFANSHSQILLATALIVAESKSGTAIVLRSLLDQGSQASFVTESAVQLLGLKGIPTKGSISYIGCDQEKSSIPLNSMVLIKVKSRIDPSFIITVKAYVLKKLTTILPERKKNDLILVKNECARKLDCVFDGPFEVLEDLGVNVKIIKNGKLDGRSKIQTERKSRRRLGAREYKNYSQEMLKLAVELVQNDKLSARAASRQFSIPKQTILNKVHNKHNKSVGCPPRLSAEEEAKIVKVLIAAANFGCPHTKLDLRLVVFEFLKKNDRQDLVKGQLPGKAWVDNFLLRNACDLTIRKSQNIKTARVEKSVDDFMTYLKKKSGDYQRCSCNEHNEF